MIKTLNNQGVVAPAGFKVSAVRAGLKKQPDALDIALLYSTTPAATAALFTKNQCAAAPVKLSQQKLTKSKRSIGY